MGEMEEVIVQFEAAEERRIEVVKEVIKKLKEGSFRL
jgi:hypothetical protein